MVNTATLSNLYNNIYGIAKVYHRRGRSHSHANSSREPCCSAISSCCGTKITRTSGGCGQHKQHRTGSVAQHYQMSYERRCPHCPRVTRWLADSVNHERACRQRANAVQGEQSAVAHCTDSAIADCVTETVEDQILPAHGLEDDGDLSEDSCVDDLAGMEQCEDSDGNDADAMEQMNVVERGWEEGGYNDCLPVVTYLQLKAAVYICASGRCRRGLSIKETTEYLKSLDSTGEVRRLWPNGRAFWKDHGRRQKAKLDEFGKWSTCIITSGRADVENLKAYVRNLPTTLQAVILNSKYAEIEGQRIENWEKHLNLEPETQFDSRGKRILTNWFSADDVLYLRHALTAQGRTEKMLPCQFFIDKANVTRLNKRQMYPVVLYLLCFSREVQRKVAVNVAFIPIVRKTSISGRKLSGGIISAIRRHVLHKTLEILFQPLHCNLIFSAHFPNGTVENVLPLVVSIVADAAEAASLSSSRFGVNTNFPCPRCGVPKESLHLIDIDDSLLRTSQKVVERYAEVSRLSLKAARNQKLKSYSMQMPRPVLLSRFEAGLDTPRLNCQVQSVLENQFLVRSGIENAVETDELTIRPFGISSFLKFESMHNFDLGLTADILREIPNYFSVFLGSYLGPRIVKKANNHQSMLPRVPTTGMFRLSCVGTVIATDHANVTAQNQFSALVVLPFLLRGSNLGVLSSCRPMFYLLRVVLNYIRLHHFVRRVNCVPWHVYSTVESELHNLTNSFSKSYVESLGITKGRNAESGPAVVGSHLATLKSHQLYCHVGRDIKGGGNTHNYNSEPGEKKHVDTRAHYARSNKQDGAEGQISIRTTTREISVLNTLYPCIESDSFSDEENGSGEMENPAKRLCNRPYTNITTELVDGMSPLHFINSLKAAFSEGFRVPYRRLLQKLRVVNTVQIEARFPWTENETHPSVQDIYGRVQNVRAARSFHGYAHYDFVEYQNGPLRVFGQVRLLFEQPYEDAVATSGKYLALVRVLEEAQPVYHCAQDGSSEIPGSSSSDVYWRDQCTELLVNSGCSYFKWAMGTTGIIRNIVAVDSLLRIVSIVPDFEYPIAAEKGSKLWKELTAKDVEQDTDRYNRAERVRMRKISRMTLQGLDCSSVPPTPPIRSLTEGPVAPGKKEEERFFHNIFMPWSKPGNK